MKHTRNITDRLLLLVATTAAWYLAAAIIATPYLLPYPHQVIAELASRPLLYLRAEAYTSLEAIVGLAIATLVSLSLSVFIFFVPLAENYVMPCAIGVKATPVIALAPLLAVWCGPGLSGKMIMSSLISFFPILQGVNDAFKGAPKEVRAYMRVLGTPRFRDLRYVRMYLALPAFASALKVAAPLAVVGAMVSEFLGADVGVGHLLFMFVSKAQTKEIFAAILSVVVIGWTLYWGMTVFERYVLLYLKIEQESRDIDGTIL